MSRIKRGTTAHKRRTRLLKRTKGFSNRRSTNFVHARMALLKADSYSYRDRRNKKRNFRALWLIRLNAALRENGTTWSKFAGQMKKAQIQINRKTLSELAISYPKAFDVFAASM